MYKLYAKNNYTQANVDLVEFLKNNLNKLVKHGHTFKFIIVKDKELKKLVKEKNIKGLPAMETTKKIYQGSTEIIDALKSVLPVEQNKTKKNKTENYKNQDEADIANFYANELSFEAVERDKNENNEDDLKNSLEKKYREELEKRNQQNQTKKSNKPSQPPQQSKRPDNIQTNQGADDEDFNPNNLSQEENDMYTKLFG